jgi:hypothetical protein
MWWAQRRPEIVADFEREVYGRIPEHVPEVTWEVVKESTDGVVGGIPVVGKQPAGHVDNSAYPAISVDIEMTLVTPAETDGPVPVLMMFGRRGLELPTSAPAEDTREPGEDPPSTEQLIAAGWGYAYINPASIQADNGAGLTRGIIGLVNKGQPRKPDDYGIPENGDALWLDQQGSYMATVAASPIFRLLGAQGIGDGEDYHTAQMPPVETGLLDGELAWRQHVGGHEDWSNMKYFIAWADKFIGHTPPAH